MKSFGFGLKYVRKKSNNKNTISPCRKKVFAFNDKFELIQTFDTCKQAAEHFNIGTTQLGKRIKTQKLWKGIYLSFENPIIINQFKQWL